MATTNVTTQIADSITTQNVNLLRFAANETNKILDVLLQLEKELLADVEDVVGKSDFTLARLRALIKQTRDTINSAYSKITVIGEKGAVDIVTVTAAKTVAAINAAVGVKLASVDWSPAQLKKIANDTVIRGSFLADWFEQQGGRLQDKFEQEMQMGLLRGETIQELTQRIRGTKALDYTDGIMQASRNQAEALVRTSALSVSNNARMEVYGANDDVIQGVQWVSTLDDRTTFECMALDGCVWQFPEGDGSADYVDYIPVDHDKQFEPPPIHWNCRSTVVPVTYSWDELGGRDADKVPEGKRASMDGEVAEGMTFEDWLGTKSESFQDEVLGPKRAEMWRAGEITLKGLTDQSNNPLTLDQLQGD